MPVPSDTWTGGFGLTDAGGLGTAGVGWTGGVEGFGWWTCGTTVGFGLTCGAAGFGACTAGCVVAGGLLGGLLTGGAGGCGV